MPRLHFTSDGALIEAAVAALKDGLCQARGRVAFEPEYPGYVANEGDNLVQPELLAEFRAQFKNGAGGELEPRRRRGRSLPAKMNAIRSSSALALNLFGPWSADSERLAVGSHGGFAPPRFEHRLPAVSGRQPPHLDVFLQGDGMTVGIEVKCLEYLSKPVNAFADAYAAIPCDDPRRRSPWFEHMKAIPALGYRRLRAAQLVKHYFGLAQLEVRPLTLLYLYWMPVNWADITVRGPDGGSVNPFEEHEREVERFAAAVAGDEATNVRFKCLSTLDLFAQWAALGEPAWLKAHAGALEARYAVALTSRVTKPVRESAQALESPASLTPDPRGPADKASAPTRDVSGGPV